MKGRPPGSKNKDLTAFRNAFDKAARKAKFDIHVALVALCQDEDKSIRLQAIKCALLLMHAKPVPIIMPVDSVVQLSFLPAEPEPEGNIYDGQVIQ